jgi:hypothetical protein
MVTMFSCYCKKKFHIEMVNTVSPSSIITSYPDMTSREICKIIY